MEPVTQLPEVNLVPSALRQLEIVEYHTTAPDLSKPRNDGIDALIALKHTSFKFVDHIHAMLGLMAKV